MEFGECLIVASPQQVRVFDALEHWQKYRGGLLYEA